MTTQSTEAKSGTRPSLNDLELGNCLSVITYQARQINELTANRKALSLAECLTKIEDAARRAHWRLVKLCDQAAKQGKPHDSEPASPQGS